jgi:hypothetical protein
MTSCALILLVLSCGASTYANGYATGTIGTHDSGGDDVAFVQTRQSVRLSEAAMPSNVSFIAIDKSNVNASENTIGNHSANVGENTNLRFVYVVGVEGVNHHGVMAGLIKPLSLSQACEHESNCKICINDKKVRKALLHGDIKVDEVISHGSRCEGFILEATSLPSWKDRIVPAPINLTTMFTKLSPRMDTRLVVLQRDFYDMVMAHPSWDGGAKGHAEKMVEYMEYISQALKGMPSHAWRTLRKHSGPRINLETR